MSQNHLTHTKTGQIKNQELNNIVFRKISGIGYKAKLVLLAIINFRDQDNNTCWPSAETLAKATELSDRSVCRGLEVLLKEKIVTRVSGTGRNGRVSTYMVTVGTDGKHDPSMVPRPKPRKKAVEVAVEDEWSGHGMTESQAEKVFKHWVWRFDMGDRYRFTPERRKAIKARAQEGTTAAEAFLAIRGYWLALDNYLPSGKTREQTPATYDFCLIFRSDTHMRQFYRDAEEEMNQHGVYLSDNGRYFVDSDNDRTKYTPTNDRVDFAYN